MFRLAAAAPFVFAACSDPPPAEICDGSSGVRLAVQALVGAGNLEAGEQVVFDHGSVAFFLNGRCEYFLRWGGNPQADFRSGELSDPDALSTKLGLASLHERSGYYSGGVADAALFQIAFEGDAIGCAGCDRPGVPEWFQRIFEYANEEFPARYEQSTSLDLPQRVVLVRQEGSVPYGSRPWPAALDPETVALSETEAVTLGFGDSTLVEGADADALRELRRTVDMGSNPPSAIYIAPTQDQQPPDYRLYLRDALPWEDARGLVPVPGP